MQGPDLRLQLSDLLVVDNQVTVTVTVLDGPNDLYLLKNNLENHIRSIIDLFGYRQGLTYDIDMVSAVAESGEQFVFELGVPAIKQAHQAKSGQQEIDANLVKIAIDDQGARLALADFRKAIKDVLSTGFYCYRAIESMMHGTTASSKGSSGDWDKFRLELNLDRAMIDYVKARADDRRHGRAISITDQERKKVFLITDKIIERYFAYISGNRQKLSAPDFALLTEAEFK